MSAYDWIGHLYQTPLRGRGIRQNPGASRAAPLPLAAKVETNSPLCGKTLPVSARDGAGESRLGPRNAPRFLPGGGVAVRASAFILKRARLKSPFSLWARGLWEKPATD